MKVLHVGCLSENEGLSHGSNRKFVKKNAVNAVIFSLRLIKTGSYNYSSYWPC
jgi:hypothetical protein